MRIFLFHHAGGDKYSFRKYMELLEPDMDPVAIEIPGHGDRFGEPILENMQDLTEDVFSQIKDSIDEDYCFFGNSMGALISCLLTKKIQELGLKLPKHIFLTSRKSPESYRDYPKIAGRSSEEFWEGIIKYGGCPQALLDHEELREMYESILRADFKALEDFDHDDTRFLLNVPATVLFGKEDRINFAEAKSWENHFTKSTEVYEMEGGHFFLFDKPEKIVEIIKEKVLDKISS